MFVFFAKSLSGYADCVVTPGEPSAGALGFELSWYIAYPLTD